LLSKNLKIKIYRTIILPVVLYGCETWSLTLREGHRLRLFENRVLRRIFGPKRDKVTGEWRTVAYPGFFFWAGVQQIQLRTEGRENGDLGAVAPWSWVRSICKVVKSVFILSCFSTEQ
jgi:hypothetical protein